MMKFLLQKTDIKDFAIVIGVLILGLLVAFLIAKGIKRMDKKTHKMVTKHEPKNINLKLVTTYLGKREMAFLNILHKALPQEFIAFPKVALSNLVVPNGDKVSYNLIYDECVDITIFARDTMEPLLVIDLFKAETINMSFDPMSELARKALKSVKLPILTINIEHSYDVVKLRREILGAMPDKVITYLKQNLL